MTTHYHPPQRTIAVRALTLAGWVSGTLRVPLKSRLVEFLDHARELVPLVDVKVEAKVDRLPFLALRRSTILFIIPPEGEPIEALQFRPNAEHAIECMMANGFVSGRFELPKGVRLSDHLALHPSTLAIVREAHVRMRDPWSSDRLDFIEPRILLNTSAIVGITEAPEFQRDGFNVRDATGDSPQI